MELYKIFKSHEGCVVSFDGVTYEVYSSDIINHTTGELVPDTLAADIIRQGELKDCYIMSYPVKRFFLGILTTYDELHIIVEERDTKAGSVWYAVLEDGFPFKYLIPRAITKEILDTGIFVGKYQYSKDENILTPIYREWQQGE